MSVSGKRLFTVRRIRGLSQQQVADHLKISRPMVAHIEIQTRIDQKYIKALDKLFGGSEWRFGSGSGPSTGLARVGDLEKRDARLAKNLGNIDERLKLVEEFLQGVGNLANKAKGKKPKPGNFGYDKGSRN